MRLSSYVMLVDLWHGWEVVDRSRSWVTNTDHGLIYTHGCLERTFGCSYQGFLEITGCCIIWHYFGWPGIMEIRRGHMIWIYWSAVTDSRRGIRWWIPLYFPLDVVSSMEWATMACMHQMRGPIAFDWDLWMFSYYIVGQLAMTYGMMTRGLGVDRWGWLL